MTAVASSRGTRPTHCLPNANFIRKQERISVILGLWGEEDEAGK
ncbi:hypothetical protein [Calothrix sp. NIES-2100]